jgi:predicted MPP superfamily phosphohydrolase
MSFGVVPCTSLRSLSAVASLPEAVLWIGIAVLGTGLLCVAYGVLVERKWYRSTRYAIRILPPSSAPVRILHLSDLHMVAADRRKARFIGTLERPDVAVVTGDILGEPQGVEVAVAALRQVRGRTASYFVLGSNDYFAPRPLNYSAYFRRRRARRRKGVASRTGDLVRQLEADGWVHLKNRRAELANDGTRLEVVGLDDPHIERQDLRMAIRPAGDGANGLGLAVVHSPDPAPELAALGYGLILAGHTHGGQVRLPFVGALVTNSHIPTRLCMGLSRLGPAYLHVSPGLGTSKFAPFRFLCRPEATLIELTARGPLA